MYLGGMTLKEVGVHLNISYWTVLDRLKRAGVRKTIKHSINHNSFNDFNVNSCYWAGFIAADGNIHSKHKSVGIELSEKDSEHLRKICRYVGRDTKLWFRERKLNNKKFKMVSVSLQSKQIVDDLYNNFSIVQNKSFILKSPQNMPKKFNKHFVRGFVDGDGSIGWHKHNKNPRIHVISGSYDILEWIVGTIKEETKKCSNVLVHKRKDNNIYNFEINGKQTYKVLDWLYHNSDETIRLDRKYKRFIEYLKKI